MKARRITPLHLQGPNLTQVSADHNLMSTRACPNFLRLFFVMFSFYAFSYIGESHCLAKDEHDLTHMTVLQGFYRSENAGKQHVKLHIQLNLEKTLFKRFTLSVEDYKYTAVFAATCMMPYFKCLVLI